jgi:predicted oxidoreductase (fatty acid repression mutant protein)
VKTRLQNIVNNQESIKNELKEGNFKNALSTIMDFDANGVLSAENKVNFYYEEKQVFD